MWEHKIDDKECEVEAEANKKAKKAGPIRPTPSILREWDGLEERNQYSLTTWYREISVALLCRMPGPGNCAEKAADRRNLPQSERGDRWL
ncbi:unnamed protein product [Symbiodinium microadriaticum]|nr:unnamed protein product [Symbiodinium microadriaticum]